MTTIAERVAQMDGPQLTRLALALGLFPDDDDPGHTVEIDAVLGVVTYLPAGQGEIYWRPHADLAQADAVFRGLRARGWSTVQEWLSTLGCGTILATKGFPGGPVWARELYHYEHEAEEALALLRVSVKAVASETKTLVLEDGDAYNA